MKKALIYCRVSTDEQAGDERHSLKTQLRLCERAIEESKVFKLAENGKYEDPGKSATNMNRPGLQDMLIRIQEDKSIKAIFIQDTDRLARNAGDHLTIKALLRKHDVDLISVSQPGLENTPEGNFMDLVIAGVNQLQSQITSRKTLKSMEQKYKDGWWPTKAPIGYINSGDPNDDKKRIITVDEFRAPFIAECFKLYATGDYSLIELRDLLYKRGFVTLVGKKLVMSKMFCMMKCHFYYGDMHWRGMVQKGNHTPIITKELFEKCQRVMDENNRFACRRRKFSFILRGFVFCNKCGRRYTAAHHHRKGISYYYCTKSSDQKRCADHYVQVYELEQQITEKFEAMQFSEAMVEMVVAKLKVLYEAKKSDVGHRKKQHTTSKFNLEKKLEVAEEKLINGVLSDEEFTKLKKKYREQIDGIEDEIHKLDQTRNLRMDIIQDILLLMRDIGTAYKKAPDELKRLYLGLFWDQFKAEDKKIVEATKSQIVLSLEKAGQLTVKEIEEIQKPDPENHRDQALVESPLSPHLSPELAQNSAVTIRPERGA
jgi:DNA invertase Pin-like site-specific DNA recombinase